VLRVALTVDRAARRLAVTERLCSDENAVQSTTGEVHRAKGEVHYDESEQTKVFRDGAHARRRRGIVTTAWTRYSHAVRAPRDTPAARGWA
jgi:hypothetical protein